MVDSVDDLNPLTEKLTKKREGMIDTLLNAGYKKDEIVDFLYLTASDVKTYIKQQKKAIEMANEIIKNQTKETAEA